jgi:redox-sensitive bicupin YhaK (pirin superfamily)
MTAEPQQPSPALVDPQYQAFLDWQASQKAAAEAEQPKETRYYVHLADGRVEVLGEEEASQSHYEGVKVIDKYQVGE